MQTKTFDSLPAQTNSEDLKASGNQAMVHKIWAPGFNFVPVGAISAINPGRELNEIV